MIAGPNGAGKTTIASALISQEKDVYLEFINADQIAQGLSPLHPESVRIESSKLMMERFLSCIERGKSFIFETTGSGRNYANHLQSAKKVGYEINLLFVWISSPDQAVERVAQRVKQGGHDIPEVDIRRRYNRGLTNFFGLYLPVADTILVIDNSSTESGAKKIIAKKDIDSQLEIIDIENWRKMRELSDVKKE